MEEKTRADVQKDLEPAAFVSFAHTGCSLNIVFFSRILKYPRLLPFSVFPRYQAGRVFPFLENIFFDENVKSSTFLRVMTPVFIYRDPIYWPISDPIFLIVTHVVFFSK